MQTPRPQVGFAHGEEDRRRRDSGFPQPGFDPELLFVALKRGYTVREVPVTWGHDERSRMSYLKDGIKMLEDMARIRANSIAGRYDEAIAALKDTSTMITAPVKPVVKVRAKAR